MITLLTSVALNLAYPYMNKLIFNAMEYGDRGLFQQAAHSEKMVKKAVAGLAEDKVVIMAAHRTALYEEADQIVTFLKLNGNLP